MSQELTMEQELARKQKVLDIVNDPDEKKKDIFVLEQLFRFDDDIQEVKGDVKALKGNCLSLPFKVDKKRAAVIATVLLGMATAMAEFIGGVV